jgi:hypothetical protein
VACVAALLTLTAQSPAPSAPATLSVPLRKLVYTFSADYEGLTESHSSAISPFGAKNGGVNANSVSAGRQGTIEADVLSIAEDGSLVVRISEWDRNEPRPRQTYTCNVYGNTTVVCPTIPEPSDAEWSLLGYLGRRFFDGAPWDPNNHWARKEDTADFSLAEDFTMTSAGDGNVVTVQEKKIMNVHDVRIEERRDDVTIVYDRAREVPLSVRDEMHRIAQGVSADAVFDFHLSSDSLASAGTRH